LFLTGSFERLPPTASQWGEPLIVAYDVGYGTDEDLISAQQNVSPDFLATIDDSGKLIIKKRDGFLFDCVDVSIEEGSINCLLGPHDSSSFLLKILAKKLQPVEGTVHHASGLQVGYCSAQIINELTSSIDATTTALEYLTPRYPQKTEKDIRGHLTLFGLSPESQAKTPLCYLSGGESFRFALAVLMLDDPPVLCIENPTSSLDVESVNALIHGLQNWNGTLVMTSVDAFFLRSLDGVKCFVIVPEEGKLRRISSEMQGIDGYLRAFKYTEW
jgi:ATPase subunit of ABC transporter with duplicated ATPase domains